MKCEQAAQLIVDDLTGNLSSAESEDLRRHVETCASCRAEAESLRETWQGLGKLAAPVPGAAGVARLADQLAGTGASAARPRSTPWSGNWKVGAAIAASLMLSLVVGYGIGARSLVVPEEEAGLEFLLLLREPMNPPPGVVVPSNDQAFREYGEWATQLANRGSLIAADPLDDDGAVWLSGPDGTMSTVDPGNAPVIGGFFLIRADNVESALETARASPHLKYGGTIELRAVVGN